MKRYLLILAALLVGCIALVAIDFNPFRRTLHIEDACPEDHPCEDRSMWQKCCVAAVMDSRAIGVGWAEATIACGKLADTVSCEGAQ